MISFIFICIVLGYFLQTLIIVDCKGMWGSKRKKREPDEDKQEIEVDPDFDIAAILKKRQENALSTSSRMKKAKSGDNLGYIRNILLFTI